jgi:hypothetical protein
MRKALIAGFWYFAAGFGAGYALGAIRVLFVEPRLGQDMAIMIEAPIMLAITWRLSGFFVRRFDVSLAATGRLLMGALALTLLLCAETLLGLAMGQSLDAQIQNYDAPGKLIGLAAQILFALFPLLQALIKQPDRDRR